ncbi:MAG: ribosomal protein S18-alanine N-acetyltransferase [Burkholderiaceae bacterium]
MRALGAAAHPAWAEPSGALQLLPLTTAQLDAVMAIESVAYNFPWTRGNFIDSLAAGYPAKVLWDERRRLLGYYVAMAAANEMHLLNITVAPAAQSRGHARHMLADLMASCRQRQAGTLWLEVRLGNARARAIYARMGFAEVGLRRGYYPAPGGGREDAAVLSLTIDPERARNGLD